MKKIIDSVVKLKNIPVIIIDKDIEYINDKAKKLLHYSKNNQQIITSEILNAIKNKTYLFEISNGSKKRNIYIQTETLKINKHNFTLCILFDLSEQNTDIFVETRKKLALYEEMFDNLPIGILIHENGNTKYINKYGMKVLETKSQKEYLNYFILNFLINEKDKARAIKRMQSKDNYLPPEIFQIKTFKGNQKVVELYSYFFPFNESKKENIVRLIVFTDKTPEIEKQKQEVETQIKIHENKLLKKQNEEKEKLLKEIQTKQEQLLNTINHSDYLFWITDNKLNFVIFNHAFYQYCYKFYNIKIKTGNNTDVIISAENKEQLLAKRKFLEKIILEKKEITYEISHFDRELNKIRIFKMTMKPVFDENKNLQHFYCYGHEITEKYEFLNQIEHQTIKLNEIIEHSPIYLWSMNKNQEITLFNKNYHHLIEELYGHKPEIGKKLSKGKYSQNKEIINQLNYHYQKAFNGSHENFKLTFQINENKKIVLDVNLFPIIINNEIKEVSGIAADITNEIEKQNQLQNLLAENEVLMKEVHHRIKNNLQVISSMINLQLQQEKDLHTKNILIDTQNRVYSMAMIHQTLYQNRNYTSINISHTILELTRNILYTFNKTDIQVNPEIEEIILDVNTAIPLALIVNESITNVVKYAFPENFNGDKNIYIVLKRNGFNIELSVKDNGLGIPVEKMNQTVSNIGFTIIRALSEQINAKLFITSKTNEGTEIKLLIPQV